MQKFTLYVFPKFKLQIFQKITSSCFDFKISLIYFCSFKTNFNNDIFSVQVKASWNIKNEILLFAFEII